MIKSQSRRELIESLVPLVIPMLRDKAFVSIPIPGNVDSTAVIIRYQNIQTEMSTDIYEAFRIDVLQYIQNYMNLDTGVFSYNSTEINRLIKDRIEKVFSTI